MKILPCRRCKKPALATKTGIVQSCGQMLDSAMSYLCVRCGRVSSITSFEFAMLPEMQEAEIRSAACDISWTDDMTAQLQAPEPLPPVKTPKPLDPNRKASLPRGVDPKPEKPTKSAKTKAKASPAKPLARRRRSVR